MVAFMPSMNTFLSVALHDVLSTTRVALKTLSIVGLEQ